MSTILVIAEHADGQLNPSTAKTVKCASGIGGDVTVAVLGADVASVAEQAAAIEGVDKVLTVERAENAHPLAAILAPQIVALADGYSHVLLPSTTYGKDVAPRVAALLGVEQVSDIQEVLGAYEFKRPIYAGNAIVTVKANSDVTLVATARTASYSAAASGEAKAGIEAASIDVELPSHSRFVKLESSESDRPDLQTAERVVSGGRALGSSENFELVYKVADKLGAGVGASRAAVDAGYVPNDMQVGQTGKIIAPGLYIAVGISGAIQHLTGIKDAGTIVAINKDADAPIFEIADIGLVGDLFQILPELEQKL